MSTILPRPFPAALTCSICPTRPRPRPIIYRMSTTISRSRGPSHSTSAMPCQVPSRSRPSRIGTVSDGPRIMALRYAAPLSSTFVLPDALGEEAVERAHHIQAEPGIGVLVDDDGRRRMTDEDSADPLVPPRARQHLGDLAGDVHHFLALGRLDSEHLLHRRASLDNALHREVVSFTMPYADVLRPMGGSL